MEKILAQLITKLQNIDWALIGSFNLKVQGIDINANDLDILTTNTDLEKIAEIFNSEIIGERGFKETKISLDNIEIQFIGMEDSPLRNKNSLVEKVYIEYQDLKLPCVPLKYDLEFYQKSGREKDLEKVRLIIEKLSWCKLED